MLGRKLRLSEGMIRIKFQMAEAFIDGCPAMLDIRLEMDY
ncbi:antiterminator Q family protein [Enterobacter hormaechei]